VLLKKKNCIDLHVYRKEHTLWRLLRLRNNFLDLFAHCTGNVPFGFLPCYTFNPYQYGGNIDKATKVIKYNIDNSTFLKHESCKINNGNWQNTENIPCMIMMKITPEEKKINGWTLLEGGEGRKGGEGGYREEEEEEMME